MQSTYYHFFFCSCKGVDGCQCDPAVRADPFCHDDRYQGDDEGEGVRSPPGQRVAATAEEEASGGGLRTQEKVGVY